MELEKLTIKRFHRGLVEKEFRALEIAQAYFAEAEQRDLEVGAYLSLHQTQALQQAEGVDLAIERGEAISPLAGVPLGIKDNILIKDLPATAASKMLQNYTASYDAFVSKKLKEAGVVFLGKTNMDEFAMGSSTENSGFHITRNPHDTDRVPGGSSGGSAAAVAANMALAALGSDTFGSIRQPAAFCGVVGLKPTYGAVSRSGLIALGSSLDQIGPITKTVEDAATIFQHLAGKDSLDATSVDATYPNALLRSVEETKKLKVGIPKEYFIAGLDKEIEGAVQDVISELKESNIEFAEVSLPHTEYAVPAYYTLLPAEVSANLARFDGVRYGAQQGATRLPGEQRSGFGKEAKRRILLGTFVLSAGYHDAYYKQAQKVRMLIKQDFDTAFEKVDVLLTPVTPTPPFEIGEKVNDPVAMYLSDIFTGPVNLAGLPALSLPVRSNRGKLPIGFQLIGNYFKESDILSLGHFYERIHNSK